MRDLRVDPGSFSELHPDPGPDSAAPRPDIRMVVSLTFPGMDRAAHDLQESFTRIAFDAVRAAGGVPALVDSAAEELIDVGAALDGADGVVFLGGGDVDVRCYDYPGPPPANEYGVDRRADQYCVNLIQESVRQDLPVLAICRGSQLFNVAFGGTLIPDILDFSPHHGAEGSPLFVDEPVRLDPDSRIAGILGRTEISVRNGHHQAVDRVASQLRVSARAVDGLVEGTEHRTASWAIGVQWHPEEPQADVEDRAAIFGELVARARGRAHGDPRGRDSSGAAAPGGARI